MMKKKTYEAPRTVRTDVELEQGFMNASVFPMPENTERLDIADQQKHEHTFDFTESEWGNSSFTQN